MAAFGTSFPKIPLERAGGKESGSLVHPSRFPVASVCDRRWLKKAAAPPAHHTFPASMAHLHPRPCRFRLCRMRCGALVGSITLEGVFGNTAKTPSRVELRTKNIAPHGAEPPSPGLRQQRVPHTRFSAEPQAFCLERKSIPLGSLGSSLGRKTFPLGILDSLLGRKTLPLGILGPSLGRKTLPLGILGPLLGRKTLPLGILRSLLGRKTLPPGIFSLPLGGKIVPPPGEAWRRRIQNLLNPVRSA